jgi:hypothetical protein
LASSTTGSTFQYGTLGLSLDRQQLAFKSGKLSGDAFEPPW